MTLRKGLNKPTTSLHAKRTQSPASSTMMPPTSRSLWYRSLRFLSTKAARPFNILGVQQIAIGCASKSPLDKLWKTVFGLHASSTHRIERENVVEDILQLGPTPFTVEVDLMVPIDAEKSPKVRIAKRCSLSSEPVSFF